MTYREELIDRISKLTDNEADAIMCYREKIKVELNRCEDVSLLDLILKLLERSTETEKKHKKGGL